MATSRRRFVIILSLLFAPLGCASAHVCGFDDTTTATKLYEGSSHANIWSELVVDWSTGRLTGRVSRLSGGKPEVVAVNEPLGPDALDPLREQLRKTCGSPSTVTEPSDVAGGSPYVAVTSSARPEVRIVTSPHDGPVGARVIEIDRAGFEALRERFPSPAR